MKPQFLTRLWPHIFPNIGTLVLLVFILWSYTAWAAPVTSGSLPTLIPYQGTLTTTAGQPVNGNTDLIFKLYTQPTGGDSLWTEAHTGSNAVPVTNGLFNVTLGSLTAIPATVWDNPLLYLGITVGSEAEMLPREQLGAVPAAMQAKIALTVADGSITTGKIANGAVTLAKLDSTGWTDVILAAGFHSPPNQNWQKSQYRRIGDIIYLRGLITKDSGDMSNGTTVMILPAGFRPPKNLAFVAEAHENLTTKHRVTIQPDGSVVVTTTAGSTPHVSLDGIFFSVTP